MYCLCVCGDKGVRCRGSLFRTCNARTAASSVDCTTTQILVEQHPRLAAGPQRRLVLGSDGGSTCSTAEDTTPLLNLQTMPCSWRTSWPATRTVTLRRLAFLHSTDRWIRLMGSPCAGPTPNKLLTAVGGQLVHGKQETVGKPLAPLAAVGRKLTTGCNELKCPGTTGDSSCRLSDGGGRR